MQILTFHLLSRFLSHYCGPDHSLLSLQLPLIVLPLTIPICFICVIVPLPLISNQFMEKGFNTAICKIVTVDPFLP